MDFGLGALRRRKAQTLGLVLCYALVVFVLASGLLFVEAMHAEVKQVLAQAPELVVQKLVAGRPSLVSPDILEKLQPLRGVQRQEPRLWGYFYDAAVKANYTFWVPPADAPLQVEPHTLLIGPAMARLRGLAPGDNISFRNYAGQATVFRIAKVLPQESELASADLVLLSEADFRAFFNFPEGHYADIAFYVANSNEVPTVAAKLVEAFPELRPISRDEMLRTYAALFHWRSSFWLALTGLALLALVLVAWDRASGLSARERRDMHILKAMGWSTADLLNMKLWEGALTSVVACCLGYVAAYLHVFYAQAALFRPVLQGWASLYPRFQLSPSGGGVPLLVVLAFIAAPYALALILPSWRASRPEGVF